MATILFSRVNTATGFASLGCVGLIPTDRRKVAVPREAHSPRFRPRRRDILRRTLAFALRSGGNCRRRSRHHDLGLLPRHWWIGVGWCPADPPQSARRTHRSEEHTSELQ